MCPNHLPAAKIPREVPQCWYSNCTTQRPKVETVAQRPKVERVTQRPMVERVPVSKSPKKPCAWEKCTEGFEGGRAEARSKSKYCSTNCKNKRARYNYNLRKKNKVSIRKRQRAYEQKA